MQFSDQPPKKTEKTIDEQKTEIKEVATKRLNTLLASMSTDSNLSIIKAVVSPPKATSRSYKNKSLKTERTEVEAKPRDLVEATKQVAAELGGDKQQTESELLTKLLHYASGDAERSAGVDRPTKDAEHMNLRYK